VEPGKLADILIIQGDPLQDIRATRNIQTVILDGKVVDTTLDPNFRNPMPRTFWGDIPSEDPTPEIYGISPHSAHEGAAGVALSITGAKFSRQSVVRFDTTDLPTRFISDSELSATVSPSLLKKVGTYPITVENPGSMGGTARAAYFLVSFKD